MFYVEETVIQVTLASFYPVLLMSGIIWPIEAQPTWLSSTISRYLPLTYASESFRAILERGWSLCDYTVLRGFIVTYAWTLMFSLVFLLLFSYRLGNAR
jgi:ABC-type multidrug transport system permease subunit